MANIVYEIATDIVYPHLTIERRLSDGVLAGYRLTANAGYVMYDTNDKNTELDPDTMAETPVTYYYTVAILPTNFNFDNFSWVAVPRDSVEENYIFGVEIPPAMG